MEDSRTWNRNSLNDILISINWCSPLRVNHFFYIANPTALFRNQYSCSSKNSVVLIFDVSTHHISPSLHIECNVFILRIRKINLPNWNMPATQRTLFEVNRVLWKPDAFQECSYSLWCRYCENPRAFPTKHCKMFYNYRRWVDIKKIDLFGCMISTYFC